MTYTAIISVPVAVEFRACDDADAVSLLDDVMKAAIERVPCAMKDAVRLVSLDDPHGVEVCCG